MIGVVIFVSEKQLQNAFDFVPSSRIFATFVILTPSINSIVMTFVVVYSSYTCATKRNKISTTNETHIENVKQKKNLPWARTFADCFENCASFVCYLVCRYRFSHACGSTNIEMSLCYCSLHLGNRVLWPTNRTGSKNNTKSLATAYKIVFDFVV